MAEWRTMPFSDAVMVNPPVRLKRGETYPFVAMADIEPTRRSVDSPQQREFRGSGARFENGDTLMARITPCLENGKISRYRSPKASSVAHGSTEFIVIRGRSGVTDNEFAYYLTQSNGVRDYAISQMSGTSGRQRVPTQSLDHLYVRVPSLAQQNAIARILGKLDDKIELNRRMNQTLEAMAQAIFKDWFADFGPTRAKANGHEPYLAPELWDLFPDALDDEDKPEGWHHWTIADLAVHHRATVAPAENPDRVFEHFSIPAYDSGRYPAIDDGASIKSRKTAIPANAVLLSKLNPNLPRVWIPNPPNSLPQVASTEFLAFTPKTPATRSLLYCLFRDIQFRREMEAMVTGTSKSHQRVSPKALVQRRVLTGASDAFRVFDRHASLLLSRVLRNTGESRILAQTRDLLLPKLMSGDIRLGEAEKAMETII